MEQELNQQGITEEATSADIPTEEKDVSKEKDIDRIVQSIVDKRLAPIYQERDRVKLDADRYKTEYDQLKRHNEELDAEISRLQDAAYADDPQLLKDARAKRDFHKKEKELGQREKELMAAQNALGLHMKALDIEQISTKYGVSKKVLERADVKNREELEEFAKEIAGERPKKAETVYDRGVSDSGEGSDGEFMKRYSEGKSDDHARAQKILKGG